MKKAFEEARRSLSYSPLISNTFLASHSHACRTKVFCSRESFNKQFALHPVYHPPLHLLGECYGLRNIWTGAWVVSNLQSYNKMCAGQSRIPANHPCAMVLAGVFALLHCYGHSFMFIGITFMLLKETLSYNILFLDSADYCWIWMTAIVCTSVCAIKFSNN